MLKRVLLLLLIVVGSEASLIANDAQLSNCPTLEATDLFTSDLEITAARLNYSQGERVINQFRLRESGTSAWEYSSISRDPFRYFSDLLPATQYEFQVSYICSSGAWTAFSETAFFTTIDNVTVEEEEEEEEVLPEPMSVDTTRVDSVQQDTVVADSMLEVAYLQIGDTVAYCGDSSVCVTISSLGLQSSMLALLTWDADVLQFQNIQIVDSFAHSVFYQTDSFHVWNGQAPLIFTDGWSSSFTANDTLAVAAICFQPIFDQVTSTAVEFDRTRIILSKDTTQSDTLINPNTQSGTIQLGSCEGIHLGGGTCDPIDGVGLTTSSVTETTAYIYNSHHNLDLNNQFRYRKKGDPHWRYTDVQQSHFRRLRDLQPGTTYEFQANQECADSSFSDYSFSFYFATHGDSEESAEDEEEIDTEIITDLTCERIDSNLLTVSTIKQFFAYIYTPQPLGPVNNQFRYRPVGTSFWFYTSISPTYYRWLRGLQDGTLYEYQVSHECSEGVWSPYSGSYQFTTLVSINLQGTGTSRSVNATTLFPNPGTDQITIDPNGGLIEHIRIISMNGQVMKERLGRYENSLQVDVGDFPEGMYIVEWKREDRTEYLKFIKQ